MLSSLTFPCHPTSPFFLSSSCNYNKKTRQGNKFYLLATVPTYSSSSLQHIPANKLSLVQETSKTCLKDVFDSTNIVDIVEKIRALPTKLRTETIDNFERDGAFQTISDFNHLFMALVTAEEFELSSKLYFNLPFYGLSPDSWTYSTLITCYCKKNEPNEAMIILNHMLEKGCEANVAIFTTLINAFCKKGRIQEAFEVFEIMGRVGCEPTINTYNCLLKGLCYTGKVEEAYELLINVKKSSEKPDIYSYTAVMDGLCKVSRSSEALELLIDAIEMGLTPNVVTYNTLFNGYFKEGRPLEGINLLKHMKERNCMPDYISYSTLLHGLLKWGEIREASKVYKEMVGIGLEVDERMTNTLLRGLCRRSRKEEELLKDVYEVFGRMRIVGCVIYPCAYDLVIEAFCNGKETKKAVLNLHEMVRMGHSPKTITFNNVIHTLCVERKVDEAISVLILMEECGRIPSYIPFNILINELNRQKMLSRACVLYGAAMKRGIQTRKKPGRHMAEMQAIVTGNN